MKKVLLLLSAVSMLYMYNKAWTAMVQHNNQKSMQPELECLANNIYFESGIEDFNSKLAVALVTLNRVNSTRYPDTFCGVVMQGIHKASWKDNSIAVPIRHKCQFSWYCDGKSDIPYKGEQWNISVSIAKNILYSVSLNQPVVDITKGATHYHRTDVFPNWAKGKKPHAQFGSHLFYKNIK